MEFEGLEEREVTDLGWDLARKISGEDSERVDAVGGGVACDTIPIAAIGVWVPGGEDVGVVEGFFDLE